MRTEPKSSLIGFLRRFWRWLTYVSPDADDSDLMDDLGHWKIP